MATMVIQTCLNVTLYVHCLVECVLVDFRHGAPNYRKTPYKKNSLILSLFIYKYLILNGMYQQQIQKAVTTTKCQTGNHKTKPTKSLYTINY